MSTLVGPGAIGFAGHTSDFYTTPYPHKPGDKGRDKRGNEYLFVDFSATVYAATLVQITGDNQASPLLGTAFIGARVGVVMGGLTTTDSGMTSNNGGWVQVYGVHFGVQTSHASDGFSSDNTVAYIAAAQTSVSSPSGTLTLFVQGSGTSIAQTSVDPIRIHGLWVLNPTEVSNLQDVPSDWGYTSGASGPVSVQFGVSAATSAFTGQAYPVFLNYPYVTGMNEPFGLATS